VDPINRYESKSPWSVRKRTRERVFVSQKRVLSAEMLHKEAPSKESNETAFRANCRSCSLSQDNVPRRMYDFHRKVEYARISEWQTDHQSKNQLDAKKETDENEVSGNSEAIQKQKADRKRTQKSSAIHRCSNAANYGWIAVCGMLQE
jgi:hypothetical protein